MWVQEEIYGHRFIEDQLPYMLVLEVLLICRSVLFDKHLVPKNDHKILDHNEFLNDQHERVSISLPKQEELRTILLRNIRIDEINADKSIEDDQKLKIWVEELGGDYDYLQERLPSRNFNEIYRAVCMLRALEIDGQNNRRWTSCFPVPRGPTLMFADLDSKWKTDRRFFGRGGEIVYLMLNRSTEHRGNLRKLLQKDFMDGDDFNCLAKKLSPPKENHVTGSALIGYLPLKTHNSYDRLAKDWCSILSLEGPSVPQKFEALSCITALNLIRYFAERSSETEHGVHDNSPHSPEFIPLDFLYGKRAELRKVSKEYLHRHREAVWTATDVHIERKLSKESRWRSVDNLDHEAVRSIIGEVFYLQEKFRNNISGMAKPEILEQFKLHARNRSHNSIAKEILPLARNAGLVAVKKGVGAWFCPRDMLLESIVYAKVSKTTLLSRFVEELYDQYGFVIGPSEARRSFNVLPCDVLRFEENLQEFESRLTRLGYVKRLSDDCAFISNPFHSQES